MTTKSIDGAYIGPVFSIYKKFYARVLPYNALAFRGLMDDFRAQAQEIALRAMKSGIPPASHELLRFADKSWYRWLRELGYRKTRTGWTHPEWSVREEELTTATNKSTPQPAQA
ncbi:MAG: hypothetical protein DRJ03_26810 [Chloroflexi bacterium]|nr:MAG: hypothetical protein DRJ03_26810 [Chloroflexota bacterium]